MKKKTVFVGMSGGVDSSVSAALLKKEGYDVVGVFIKTWHPDFLECNEEEERRDAMRVAAHLDIPFLTFDFEDVYKKEVADYMIAEYKLGRTPNPDVMCNKHVKFGAFLNKALSMGADFVATGHYARTQSQKNFSGLLQSEKAETGTFPVQNSSVTVLNREDSNNFSSGMVRPKGGAMSRDSLRFSLHTGADPAKDQSYFLWTLNQEQLSKILFPVGHLPKSEVRKLAEKFKIPVAEKKDSQGICFLGDIDLKAFLKHYIKERKGNVVNEEGEVIGRHDGVVFHTLGERHGFTVAKKTPNDTPYYVAGKDLKKNILIVSQNKNLSKDNENFNFDLKDTNWITKIPESNKSYAAQVRYHGEFLSCKIKIINKTKGQVIFDKPVLVAPGQSVVFYDGDMCLGGGVVG